MTTPEPSRATEGSAEPVVRIHLSPAERCYGAGGEDGNFVAYINRWSARPARSKLLDRSIRARLVRAAVATIVLTQIGRANPQGKVAMHILWTIIIGFIAGVIAKFITPGKNEPSGFILTTILGIVGAFVATYLGQAIGWYRADQGAGLIGAVVAGAPRGIGIPRADNSILNS